MFTEAREEVLLSERNKMETEQERASGSSAGKDETLSI